MRYEVRCYETRDEARDADLVKLEPPAWAPVVVSARCWDDAKREIVREIESRGRVARGVHIGPDGATAVIFPSTVARRPLTMRESARRYPAPRG